LEFKIDDTKVNKGHKCAPLISYANWTAAVPVLHALSKPVTDTLLKVEKDQKAYALSENGENLNLSRATEHRGSLEDIDQALLVCPLPETKF